MLGNLEGRKRREHQRMRWLDGITEAMGMNWGKLWEMVRNREAWHAAVHGVTKDLATEQLEVFRNRKVLLWPCKLLLILQISVREFFS